MNLYGVKLPQSGEAVFLSRVRDGPGYVITARCARSGKQFTDPQRYGPSRALDRITPWCPFCCVEHALVLRKAERVNLKAG